MISGWVLALALFFLVVLAVIVVLLMRILSIMEIVVRAIPLGTPRVQERRAPAPAPMGAHRRDTVEVT
jgi:hypothetical protein